MALFRLCLTPPYSRLSRSALETHLRPDFGPLSGAIKEFPIVGVEDVSFSVCHFTGGILERVAEPGASPNTWKLHFDPKISGTFKVYTNTRLVLGETTVVEKGVPTILSLTGNFTLAQQMPVVSTCFALKNSIKRRCVNTFLVWQLYGCSHNIDGRQETIYCSEYTTAINVVQIIIVLESTAFSWICWR